MKKPEQNVIDLLFEAAGRAGAASGTALTLTDGQVLYHEGETRSEVYAIESGYLKLSYLSAAGRATISAILNRGELLGPGLADEAVASQTAVASGTTQVRRYPGAAFRRLLADDNILALVVVRMLARRQRIIESRLQAVLNLNVRGRIAVVLRDLIGHYGGRCVHGHEVDVPLTQQELADMVGASRPAVSLELNRLRRGGLLNYTRGFICVNDIPMLDRLAQGTAQVSSS